MGRPSCSVPTRLMACLLGAPALALSAPAQTSLSTSAIAARATPATVTIVTFNAVGDTLAQGSGFFLRNDGTLVTAWHVLTGAHGALVILASGERYERVAFLDGDSAADVAILKVPGYGLPALPTRSTVPAVGEPVVVIGSPLGLSRTVTEGIVSARRMVSGQALVQISAAISPGSSGGPVLDGQGRVFAVATATLEEGQQLNFAVPVRYALGLLGEAHRDVPIAEVFGTPPFRVLLRLVRREAEVLSPLMVYVVPRRRFENVLVRSCAAVQRTLDSLELEDPQRVLLGLGWLKAARLSNLDLALLRVAQTSALDSAGISEQGQVGPLSVPDGGVLIGKFLLGSGYTAAQLPFVQGVPDEQRIRIADVRRPVDMCNDGLVP